MIRTTGEFYGFHDQVALRLVRNNRLYYILTWWFKPRNWQYSIEYCSQFDFSQSLSNVPADISKTWIITTAPASITVTCNSVQVLWYEFVWDDNSNCLERLRSTVANRVIVTVTDTETMDVYDGGK